MHLIGAQILAEHPEGMRGQELLVRIKSRIPDLDEEWWQAGSGDALPDRYFTSYSINLRKCGWLTKSAGKWYLTPLGRRALAAYPNPADFKAACDAGYRYWDRNREAFERVRQLLEAMPEGSWVAAADLAEQAGLETVRLVHWLQGERPEGWARVLDADGRLPDDAHADEALRGQWERLLDEEGLHPVLGQVPPARRVLGADLAQAASPGSDDGEARRRAWLVRAPSGPGGSLLEDWLRDRYCSLPASQLPELSAGVSQDTVAKAVEVNYTNSSISDRLKKTTEFHQFLSRMAEGDLVLTNDGPRIYLGRLTGGPVFRASVGDRANLQRSVAWENPDDPIDYDVLPDEISAKLATQHDVIDLSDFVAELEGLIKADPVSEPKMALPDATEALAAELLVDREWLQECVELLRDRPQLIFYGPPGTGKTYLAQELAKFLAGGRPENVKLVQFHPAYSYEDFFQGFRPVQTAGGLGVTFKPLPGPLLQLVEAARARPAEPHVLIIDEINRGNLAKIFGELYFLLEYRRKAVDLLYSAAETAGQAFTLPENLVILGTMNTADRTIALLDAAMRRRFAFVELHPEEPPTRDMLRRWLAARGLPDDAARLLEELNARIDDRDFKIGPSYLMRPAIYEHAAGFDRVWRTQILPLLEEHHYGDGTDVAERYGLPALRSRLGLGS